MRSLMKRVRALNREFQIAFYGLDHCGKSSIVRCMSGEPLVSPSPTAAFEVRRATLRGFQLTLWDIGGSKENRTHWQSFLDQVDFVVWVVDTADPARLSELQTEFDRFGPNIVERFSALLILANPIGQPICPPERLSTLLDVEDSPGFTVTALPCNPLDPSSVQRVLAWICRKFSDSS
jgi:signal recognition particle receptor subunit beta